MGSSSSRLGGSNPPPSPIHHHRHRHHHPSFKGIISSIFICGSFSSSRANHEMEDDPAEKLVNSAEHDDLEKIQIPAKNSSLPTDTVSEFSNGTNGTVVGSERGMLSGENSSREGTPGHVDTVDKGKGLSENKELDFTPDSFPKKRRNDASTSYEDEHALQPESSSARANINSPNRVNRIRNRDVPRSRAGFTLSKCSSSDGGESLSDELSVENCANDLMVFHDCDSGSMSVVSESPSNDTSQQTTPGLGFLVTDRNHGHNDRNVLQVDVVGVSSNISSSSSAELSNHDARRNSRRLFWDAFSRRSSRRNAESRSLFFTTDDPDGLESHDRWFLDFNGDFSDEAIGGDSRSYGNSNQHSSQRRWRSSSEIWERFRDVSQNGTDHRAATCPAGIHADGTCSCGSVLRSEESGGRASISRIVMLAEALFEVLDEIHRQPMSLSLSMVSLPAPESIVDSLPVKNHMKPERLDAGDDVAQCYICLAEYEEGDKIRILPCRHEYHVACVDKWLKEIHGVCPLCRGDIREGFTSTEGAISSSEVPSV